MVEIFKRIVIALGIIFSLPTQAYGQRIEAVTPLVLKAPGLRFDKPARKLWIVKAATAALGDGKMACFKGRDRRSIRPFISGKRPCLGGFAPLADMEEIRLLERYNENSSRVDMLSQRPMQSRAGLLMSVNTAVDMGVVYRFTGNKTQHAAFHSQFFRPYRDLEGHVAIARIRWSLP